MKAHTTYDPDRIGRLAVVGPEQSEIVFDRSNSICVANRLIVVEHNGKPVALPKFMDILPSRREDALKGVIIK